MFQDIVYGGLDGIITTFSIVAGANGGGLSVLTIIILGFSNVFADAMSTGVSSWMSSRAKAEYKKLEREREQWEFENNPEGEMAKYKELFLDVMMVQELELTMDDPDENYDVDGLVTFLSFFFFGSHS